MKLPMSQMVLGAGFFLILSLLVVPLPAAVLDVFLSLSLTLGLVVLLLALFGISLSCGGHPANFGPSCRSEPWSSFHFESPPARLIF